MSRATRTPDSIVTSALKYAAFGWALIPLAPRSKVPYTDLLPINPETGEPGWGPLAQWPASESTIKQWFEHDPRCNIGVITGSASNGLVVADFDTEPPDGLHYPLTPRVTTGRGLHFYFQSQAPMKSHALNITGKHMGEIKGDGGYVVMPPSLHPTGRVYEWQELLSPCEVDLALTPDWLLNTTNAYKHENSSDSGEGVHSKGYSLLCTPESLPGYQGLELGAWSAYEPFIVAVAAKVGIPLKCVEHLGRAFCCVLPGHIDQHPSASLYRRCVVQHLSAVTSHQWIFWSRASLVV